MTTEHTLNPTLQTAAARLADVLLAMCEQNERLLELADRHEAALRCADGREIDRVSRERTSVLGHLAALDRQREQWIAPWKTERVATIAAIVTRLPEELGTRLSAIGQRLRSLLESLRERHARIVEASRQMSEHLAGISRAVTQSAETGHSGYSRQGQNIAGQARPTRLDIKS